MDDYTVWDGSRPLQEKDGRLINLPGFTRSVAIQYVDGNDFSTVSVPPTDYKRITVSVHQGGQLIKSWVTVRVAGGRYVDI